MEGYDVSKTWLYLYPVTGSARPFTKKPWYTQNPGYSDSLLTDVDKENVRIIQEAENKAQ